VRRTCEFGPCDVEIVTVASSGRRYCDDHGRARQRRTCKKCDRPPLPKRQYCAEHANTARPCPECGQPCKGSAAGCRACYHEAKGARRASG
jgi:hypothetical protein